MADTYNGIRFSYDDFIDNIGRMTSLAAKFLTKEGHGALKAFAADTSNARFGTPKNKVYLQIARERPLVTATSSGAYHCTDKCDGIPVFGTLSCRWEVKNPNTASSKQREFHLIGEATTSINVFRSDDGTRVAQWQIEAGDAVSPGCHFHCAVNQYEKDGMFPEWLKVPRFPGVLLSPMDCLEFLLGELFQDQWLEAISKDSADRNAWSNGQRHRLAQVLEWQATTVHKWTSSPWMSLKKAKPHLDVMMKK